MVTHLSLWPLQKKKGTDLERMDLKEIVSLKTANHTMDPSEGLKTVYQYNLLFMGIHSSSLSLNQRRPMVQ